MEQKNIQKTECLKIIRFRINKCNHELNQLTSVRDELVSLEFAIDGQIKDQP